MMRCFKRFSPIADDSLSDLIGYEKQLIEWSHRETTATIEKNREVNTIVNIDKNIITQHNFMLEFYLKNIFFYFME